MPRAGNIAFVGGACALGPRLRPKRTRLSPPVARWRRCGHSRMSSPSPSGCGWCRAIPAAQLQGQRQGAGRARAGQGKATAGAEAVAKTGPGARGSVGMWQRQPWGNGGRCKFTGKAKRRGTLKGGGGGGGRPRPVSGAGAESSAGAYARLGARTGTEAVVSVGEGAGSPLHMVGWVRPMFQEGAPTMRLVSRVSRFADVFSLSVACYCRCHHLIVRFPFGHTLTRRTI